MARGAEGKLRRRNEKKEAKAAEAARLLEEKETPNKSDFEFNEEELPGPPGNVEEDDSSSGSETKPVKKKKKSKSKSLPPPPPPSKPIKTLPLVMLVLLTGSTLLPAFIYAGDWFGNMAQKHHFMGALGHRLGLGATPKKRVLSFYEKHDPTKLDDVPKILAKHYGSYPALVKKLERKYQDYGYFQRWEQDEAPLEFAKEKFEEMYDKTGKLWMTHAPQVVKTGARNARNNFAFLHKKGKKMWRTKLWPVLQPYFGVPDGAGKQKRADAKAARARKKGKKNREYRDEEDE